jgi:hypothetical protein
MAKRGPVQLPRALRFAQHVLITPTRHLWTGVINKKRGGYGVFYDDDARLKRAHRVAWEINTGDVLSPSEVIRHFQCDNPPCVRFDHLRKGTQGDNLDDMFAKGRDAIRTYPRERGVERYNALLDDEKVRWIRTHYDAGTMTLAEMARALGISPNCVGHAAHRRTWLHVT